MNSTSSFYRFTAYCTLLMVGLIPIQMTLFILLPPPTTVLGFFDLYAKSSLLGLLSLDFLYLINNVLIIPLYLAIYASLKPKLASVTTLALLLGLVGIAVYYPSNPAFEFISLSMKFAQATSEVQRVSLLSAGDVLLAGYVGTAFNTYYVLNAFTLIVFSLAMKRSGYYSKSTSTVGLISGLLMIIPSTFGTIGLLFSVLSLIPWIIFSIRVIIVFLSPSFQSKINALL
ncbi:MAG: hypothetical protein A2Y20_10700 [Firmicutes bacterium GWF2_51_9]|nr:MAG: hypothetical protein A2Y20_10700 [Firmicutes bacterium GWF2_51_9]OGS59448.1 MAG: hypothetical protein A2Y19_10715 [Firmicutes bacterium GWE2_51_13]HAM62774.1 hypothetical protein [Erysipelotrichaceae bacterium]HBZ42349.1 hypothetical protein [Erysipelotrichaceae bacterium]